MSKRIRHRGPWKRRPCHYFCTKRLSSLVRFCNDCEAFFHTTGLVRCPLKILALEAIALRSRDIILEMQKDAGMPFPSLKVDGGASNNNLLMQIQSDLLEKKVVRPQTTETTALGAAFLSGLAIGFWKNEEELKRIWKSDRVFTPQASTNRSQIVEQWDRQMQRILS